MEDMVERARKHEIRVDKKATRIPLTIMDRLVAEKFNPGNEDRMRMAARVFRMRIKDLQRILDEHEHRMLLYLRNGSCWSDMTEIMQRGVIGSGNRHVMAVGGAE